MKIIKNKLWPVLAIMLCLTSIYSPVQAMMQTRESNKVAVGLLCGAALATLGGGYMYYYRNYYWPSVKTQPRIAEERKPSDLGQAVQQYDCEKVYSNLSRWGADPNQRDEEGNPLLFMAVNIRKKQMVSDFLQFGADPAIPHSKTGTILATIAGHRDMNDRERCEFIQTVLRDRGLYLNKTKKFDDDQIFSELQFLINVVNQEQKPLEEMVALSLAERKHGINYTKNLIKILKMASTYQCFGYFIGNTVDHIRSDLEKTPEQAVARFLR